MHCQFTGQFIVTKYSLIIVLCREDDDGDSTGSAKITRFFSSTTQHNEHKYFRERCLKSVACL